MSADAYDKASRAFRPSLPHAEEPRTTGPTTRGYNWRSFSREVIAQSMWPDLSGTPIGGELNACSRPAMPEPGMHSSSSKRHQPTRYQTAPRGLECAGLPGKSLLPSMILNQVGQVPRSLATAASIASGAPIPSSASRCLQILSGTSAGPMGEYLTSGTALPSLRNLPLHPSDGLARTLPVPASYGLARRTAAGLSHHTPFPRSGILDTLSGGRVRDPITIPSRPPATRPLHPIHYGAYPWCWGPSASGNPCTYLTQGAAPSANPGTYLPQGAATPATPGTYLTQCAATSANPGAYLTQDAAGFAHALPQRAQHASGFAHALPQRAQDASGFPHMLPQLAKNASGFPHALSQRSQDTSGFAYAFPQHAQDASCRPRRYEAPFVSYPSNDRASVLGMKETSRENPEESETTRCLAEIWHTLDMADGARGFPIDNPSRVAVPTPIVQGGLPHTGGGGINSVQPGGVTWEGRPACRVVEDRVTVDLSRWVQGSGLHQRVGFGLCDDDVKSALLRGQVAAEEAVIRRRQAAGLSAATLPPAAGGLQFPRPAGMPVGFIAAAQAPPQIPDEGSQSSTPNPGTPNRSPTPHFSPRPADAPAQRRTPNRSPTPHLSPRPAHAPVQKRTPNRSPTPQFSPRPAEARVQRRESPPTRSESLSCLEDLEDSNPRPQGSPSSRSPSLEPRWTPGRCPAVEREERGSCPRDLIPDATAKKEECAPFPPGLIPDAATKMELCAPFPQGLVPDADANEVAGGPEGGELRGALAVGGLEMGDFSRASTPADIPSTPERELRTHGSPFRVRHPAAGLGVGSQGLGEAQVASCGAAQKPCNRLRRVHSAPNPPARLHRVNFAPNPPARLHRVNSALPPGDWSIIRELGLQDESLICHCARRAAQLADQRERDAACLDRESGESEEGREMVEQREEWSKNEEGVCLHGETKRKRKAGCLGGESGESGKMAEEREKWSKKQALMRG